jgi:signal transduction histidine kinase
MTLRLRLTLLYGVVFLIAGAALLGITYGLFAHSINSDQAVALPGPRLRFLAPNAVGLLGQSGVVTINPRVGSVTVDGRPPASGGIPRAVKPTKQQANFFAKIRANGQRQLDLYRRRASTALRMQRSHSLASLETKSGIALGIMALLSILLGWLVAGRALRPLRTMNQRAREITEESLHQRVGVEPRSDELGELAATFDALLERLERAFEAQRRFVANASHELRTPLTLERALVEVALADPDASVSSLRRCCERVLVSSAQQERVIDALLTLARGQAGVESRERVDLAELAAELLAARATDTAALTVEATLDRAVVDGDPALLERMVANLIDNAIAHNVAEDGWIRVQTTVEAGKPVLRVCNSGQIVPPERLEELFEPFRRLEGERTGLDRGLGLGLSIVRAIALAHGAEMDAEARDQGGLEVELRFAPALVRAGATAPVASAADRHLVGRVGASL